MHRSAVEAAHVAFKRTTDVEKAKRLACELEVAHNRDFFRLTVMENRLKALKNLGYRIAEDCLYDEKNITGLNGPINRPQG